MKEKVPPVVPVILAVPPSHPAVIVKDASSVIKETTDCTLELGQVPEVVYKTS